MTEVVWKGKGTVKINVSSSNSLCRAYKIYFLNYFVISSGTLVYPWHSGAHI